MVRLDVEPKFVEVKKGKRLVILDEDEWDRVLDVIDAAEARRRLADENDPILDWRKASRGMV